MDTDQCKAAMLAQQHKALPTNQTLSSCRVTRTQAPEKCSLRSRQRSACAYLALRPLRRASRAFETKLLAFLGARIALEVASKFQFLASIGSQFNEAAGNCVTDRGRLCFETATLYFCRYGVCDTKRLQRCMNGADHVSERKVLVRVLSVYHYRR